MTYHSTLKRLNLAVAMTLALGLGITRALPVQAASLTNSANQLIAESQALKLEKMTFSPNGTTNELINTSYQGQGNSTLAPNTTTTDKTLVRSAAGEETEGAEPVSPLEGIVAIGIVVAILFAILDWFDGDQGSKDQAASQNVSKSNLQKPVPVPTPALLPGLLGLGLKLLQQKKADSERSLDAEVA